MYNLKLDKCRFYKESIKVEKFLKVRYNHMGIWEVEKLLERIRATLRRVQII